MDKFMDSFNLDNLSNISRMKRYYMNDRCMNETELDPCLAAKVRLNHPSDCNCWSFWKFFCCLLLGLLLVVLFILVLITLIASGDGSTLPPTNTTTSTTTETTTTTRSTSRPTSPPKLSSMVVVSYNLSFGHAPIMTTTPLPAPTPTIKPAVMQISRYPFRNMATKKPVVKVESDEKPKKVDWTKINPKMFESCDNHVGFASPDGVHKLTISPIGVVSVRCLFDPALHQAWMIIQERQNDKLAFNQPLHRYEKGFGDVHGDHWLGLEKIYAFLKHGKKLILRVEIAGDHCGTNADERNDPTFNVHGEYNFEISGPEENYKLKVSEIPDSGNMTAPIMSLTEQNGFPFKANDADDYCQSLFYLGGWWYNSTDCPHLALNGEMNSKRCKYGGAVIKEVFERRSIFHKPTYTRMMVRIA